MAGKKTITRRRASSPTLTTKRRFSNHTFSSATSKQHRYRQHLIRYAQQQRLRQKKHERSMFVSKKSGEIYSNGSSIFNYFKYLIDAASQLIDKTQKYFSPSYYFQFKKKSKKKHRRFSVKRSRTPSKLQQLNNILAAFPTISLSKATRFLLGYEHAFMAPFSKISRLIARWNRKKSWSFRRQISQSHPQARKRNFLLRFLAGILQPFYYTFRLFPVHTFLAFFLSASILGVTWATHEFIFKDLPDPHDLTRLPPAVTTTILDRNGEVLYRLYEDENRTIVPLTQISPFVLQATIAIEDQNFYKHRGFSVKGITRAFVANYKGLTTQGGSTITQQLVKSRLLSPEKTIRRKLRELLLSILAEGIYEKEQILEMYLNQVAYGGSTYGIEAAAQRYFGKSARDLNLAESALLAGLPQAPSVYTPYGPNPELAKARQVEVLRRMVEDGYITQLQADESAAEQLAFKSDVIDIRAPHFVMYVKKLLAEKYGEDLLLQGGLEIRTTLDITLQDDVQKKVTDEVNGLARLKVSNGAALVTNPKTGEIYAMVGSKDYFDFAHDGQVNVTLRPRQPGSSIKPLTYAVALERGSTVSTIIQDQPITFSIPGSKPYSPKNYDGKYHGNVTLKESLASSYNIPAVKTLQQIGINALIDKAEEMGITTWQDRRRFGLSLTLGGGEVLMVDMAKAYGAFANEGYVTDLNPILEIHNYKGETLYQNSCALDGIGCFRKKVLDSKVAYLISNILSDNTARTPAFGPMSTLFIPNQEVAVKTGTTNNLRDNWTIGYTSDRLVAVWVGNNDNQPMSYVASGVTGASSIWNKVMTSLLDESTPHQFAVPSGVIKVATCVTTGSLPCSGCSKIREEFYVAGTEPKNVCNIAKKTETSDVVPVTDDKQNDKPTNPADRRRNNRGFIDF